MRGQHPLTLGGGLLLRPEMRWCPVVLLKLLKQTESNVFDIYHNTRSDRVVCCILIYRMYQDQTISKEEILMLPVYLTIFVLFLTSKNNYLYLGTINFS